MAKYQRPSLRRVNYFLIGNLHKPRLVNDDIQPINQVSDVITFNERKEKEIFLGVIFERDTIKRLFSFSSVDNVICKAFFPWKS